MRMTARRRIGSTQTRRSVRSASRPSRRTEDATTLSAGAPAARFLIDLIQFGV